MKELSDLDICKRIAEIEGYKPRLCGVGCITGEWLYSGVDILHGASTTRGEFNPLTDDALCFQLMVKYRITVEFTRYYEYLKSTTTKAFYNNEADNGYGLFIRDINTNKAICLAIIEAHKE